MVDLDEMERDFASLVDQLVEQVSAAGTEIRARRESAPRRAVALLVRRSRPAEA